MGRTTRFAHDPGPDPRSRTLPNPYKCHRETQSPAGRHFTVPVPASSGEFSPRARATRHPPFFFFFSVCRISLGDGPSPYGRLLAVAPPPALGPSRKFEKTSTVPPPTGRAVSPGGVLAAPAHPNSGRTNFTVKRKVRRAVIFTVPVPASSGEFSPRARATRHPLFFFFFFPRLSDLSRRLAVSLRPPSRCGPAARTWAFLKNRKNFHRAAADRAGRLSRGCSGRTRSPQLRPYKFHRETQSPAGRHFYRAGPGQLR